MYSFIQSRLLQDEIHLDTYIDADVLRKYKNCEVLIEEAYYHRALVSRHGGSLFVKPVYSTVFVFQYFDDESESVPSPIHSVTENVLCCDVWIHTVTQKLRVHLFRNSARCGAVSGDPAELFHKSNYFPFQISV